MLNERIVIFCLWDENLPITVQRGLVDKFMAAELPEMKIGKPNLPKELGNSPNLKDLVGPRSHLLFWPLRIGTNWLYIYSLFVKDTSIAQPVHLWKNDSE